MYFTPIYISPRAPQQTRFSCPVPALVPWPPSRPLLTTSFDTLTYNFIVSDPGNKPKRILDANSDVIDAAKAYLGSLDLIEQTEGKQNEVTDALDSSDDARVLLEGPARSGKTIIAMALLAKYPNSKMLLMNWYFWDTLRDAFEIWGGLSKKEIQSMFSTDEKQKGILPTSTATNPTWSDILQTPICQPRDWSSISRIRNYSSTSEENACVPEYANRMEHL